MQYGLKTDKCERLIGVGGGVGEGFGGGRIQRKGALEHRTLGPVTLHQGFKAKGAGGLDQKSMEV
jgi:hypothetical protein